MLDDNKSDTLEELDVDLTTLELKCKFFENFEKPHDFKKEKKLRLLWKEKIHEIERLTEGVKKEKDDGETKTTELFTDLEYENYDALHDITILELQLTTLEITPIQIDKIKKSILSSHFMLLQK